ncbi:MAG TPA: hypothetical protein VHE35_19205 [Kofleriaceae bacterium]|nr:hypothetical protein [Kofleriaceae bacterium]
MASMDDRPPPPPRWPELDALRALPDGVALFAPGITDTAFASALAEAGAPVPAALLELLAATDGLVVRNVETTEVVFRLETAAAMKVVERDGGPVLAIASWWLRPLGHELETIHLWLDGGALSGGYELRRAGQPAHLQRFGTRPFDVRDLLRFALARSQARAETAHERDHGIVDALLAERSWGWYLAGDVERFELLVAAGRRAAARAHCERLAADLLDDAESCTRAGDHGAATKAERARDAWLARARSLT